MGIDSEVTNVMMDCSPPPPLPPRQAHNVSDTHDTVPSGHFFAGQTAAGVIFLSRAADEDVALLVPPALCAAQVDLEGSGERCNLREARLWPYKKGVWFGGPATGYSISRKGAN